MATRWIESHESDEQSGQAVHFAIVQSAECVLIGSISLYLVAAHRHARLGYWIGVPYWNHGYATEAVRAVVVYGFNDLKLHRVHSAHFLGNAASGRVLQKAGFTYEGRMREHYIRFDRYVDLELYGLLQGEMEQPG